MDWNSFMQLAEEIAKLAPIGTAVVALAAVVIALRSLRAQKTIAKKRAAIDFFLKTEMDTGMLRLHDQFDESIARLNARTTDMQEFRVANESDYRTIRSFLNIHELLAVGVLEGVFDNKVCFQYWCDDLQHAYPGARDLIEFVQTVEAEPRIYTELVKLSAIWSGATPVRQGRRRSAYRSMLAPRRNPAPSDSRTNHGRQY